MPSLNPLNRGKSSFLNSYEKAPKLSPQEPFAWLRYSAPRLSAHAILSDDSKITSASNSKVDEDLGPVCWLEYPATTIVSTRDFDDSDSANSGSSISHVKGNSIWKPSVMGKFVSDAKIPMSEVVCPNVTSFAKDGCGMCNKNNRMFYPNCNWSPVGALGTGTETSSLSCSGSVSATMAPGLSLIDFFLSANSPGAASGGPGQLLVQPKSEETLLRDRVRRSAAERDRNAIQNLPEWAAPRTRAWQYTSSMNDSSTMALEGQCDDQKQQVKHQDHVVCLCHGVSDLCNHRPQLARVRPGSQIFKSTSTASSRAMASRVLHEAEATNKVHGRHPAPRLFAQRIEGLKDVNRHFRDWCREWITQNYHTECSDLVLPKNEPHIIKYDGNSDFKGINLHNDHSFVSIMMGLNDRSDYDGGGTYFPHLDECIHLDPGEVLVFQGRFGPHSTLHRGNSIVGGKRALYLIFFQLRGSGWENHQCRSSSRIRSEL